MKGASDHIIPSLTVCKLSDTDELGMSQDYVVITSHQMFKLDNSAKYIEKQPALLRWSNERAFRRFAPSEQWFKEKKPDCFAVITKGYCELPCEKPRSFLSVRKLKEKQTI